MIPRRVRWYVRLITWLFDRYVVPTIDDYDSTGQVVYYTNRFRWRDGTLREGWPDSKESE